MFEIRAKQPGLFWWGAARTPAASGFCIKYWVWQSVGLRGQEKNIVYLDAFSERQLLILSCLEAEILLHAGSSALYHLSIAMIFGLIVQSE